MKQQEEEYNYGWKVIEAEFHRRADELFDFQFRRRLECTGQDRRNNKEKEGHLTLFLLGRNSYFSIGAEDV